MRNYNLDKTIKASQISTPHHLAISPYPKQYETTVTTKGKLKIFIRPIKPEDAPLLVDLFHTLSRKSIYFRFFSPLKLLSPKMLALFTQIDYDRDMALVAIDNTLPKEKMLGVARIMTKPGGKRPEFAVAVGDPWQGKGIGETLMKRLMAVAKERGIESLWGLVLGENTLMLKLARKLGFTPSWSPDERCYEVKIDLRSGTTG